MPTTSSPRGTVHGHQLLAYARSGVRLAGSPTARLAETESRIEEGKRRILQRSEFQAGQLRSRASSIRASGEAGIDPGAVLISHLPSLASSALQFGSAFSAATTPQQPLPAPSYGPRARSGAQPSGLGGGGGQPARAYFPRTIDIS